jgi:outer membrane protein OmpA-like peptidoglycan-associated protein
MSSHRLVATLGLIACLPALAAAQQRPANPPPARPAATPAQRPAAPMSRKPTPHRENAWQFGIQGGVFILDQNLNAFLIGPPVAREFKSSSSRIMPGGAVSLTKQLGNHFAFGIGGAFFTSAGAKAIIPRAEFTLSTDINKTTVFFIPVGGSITRISGGTNRITSVYGAHAGVGLMQFLGQGNTAIRVEGRLSMDHYDEFTKNVYNSQVLGGLSFFFGGAPPRDTDGDMVPDKNDRCANTPRGATVDAHGCPHDSDNDRVWDGLDRCPATPANTPVDANGCPRDSDNDGVNDAADRCPNTAAGTPVDANGCARDADGDGVADNMDRCANTPRGTQVDANGCPRDSDNDGVNDAADRCPATPAGTPVDANGCPRDSDNDGVNDAADRCPGTPAGTRVDANGCPQIADADHDGVADARDRCPNTPAGRMVDDVGCPLVELPAVGASLVIRNINFVTGRANLTAASAQPLRDLAISIRAILRQSPNARFEVAGYTDNRGSAASNLSLSDRRAQSVKTAIQTAGVPESALIAHGYGVANPMATNATVAGRTQNRRVELKRIS